MKKNNTNNRSNDFENYVMSIIKSRDNNCIVHEKLSAVAMQVIKDSNTDNSILFTDAGSNYYNITGSQKGTEFVYHCPLNNIDIRIECKARKKPNLLGEIIIELNHVNKMNEKLFCLVLSNELMNDYVLDLIKTTIQEKNLTHKVWFGSAGDFDVFLAKKLHKLMYNSIIF